MPCRHQMTREVTMSRPPSLGKRRLPRQSGGGEEDHPQVRGVPRRWPVWRLPHCSQSGSLSSSSFSYRADRWARYRARLLKEARAVRTPVGLCRRGRLIFVFAVIIYSGVHWACTTAYRTGNHRCQPPAPRRRVHGGQPGHGGSAGGSVIVRVIAQQYSFVPHCIVVPANTESCSARRALT